MQQFNTKSMWVAGAAVAGVLAIGAAVFVAVDPGTSDSGEGDAAAIPRPSGSAPDPGEVPEYDAADCEYSELKVDGEVDQSDLVAVSPSGEYIAGAAGGNVPLWGPDGDATDLGEPVEQELDGIVAARASAVNSSGMVVGNSEGKTGQPNRGWVYYDGDVVELPVPDNVDISDSLVEVHPVSLNENGDIAGYITVESEKNNRSHTEYVPVRWDAGSSTATVLEADGDGAEVAGITEDGAVIGVEFHARDIHDGDPTNDWGEVWKWDQEGKRDTLPLSGGVIDVAGDWLLATDHDESYYRWNMAEDGDTEEVSLSAAIDASGRVFGERDDRASIEADAGVEELPVPDDGGDNYSYLVTAVGANSAVIAGHHIVGEEESAQSYAVAWHCA